MFHDDKDDNNYLRLIIVFFLILQTSFFPLNGAFGDSDQSETSMMKSL